MQNEFYSTRYKTSHVFKYEKVTIVTTEATTYNLPTYDHIMRGRIDAAVQYEFDFESLGGDVYVTHPGKTSAQSADEYADSGLLDVIYVKPHNAYYAVYVKRVEWLERRSPHQLECAFCFGQIAPNTVHAVDPAHPTSNWSDHTMHINCATARLKHPSKLEDGSDAPFWPRNLDAGL